MTIADHPSTYSADGLLVRAYLAGDVTAFETLYDDYKPRLVRYLVAKGHDPAVAEDVAQEAFLRSLRYLRGFDPTMLFWPWLKKIAANVATAEHQRRLTELPVEEVDRDGASSPDDADAIVLCSAIQDCLHRLPARQRSALVWRYVEDRSTADIADLLGLNRNAVEQLLNRARNALRREYRGLEASLVPAFAGFAARFRRLVSAIAARLNVASGATMSMAGDWAIGAALTLGSLGIVGGLHQQGAPDRAGAIVDTLSAPVGAGSGYALSDSRDLAPSAVAAQAAMAAFSQSNGTVSQALAPGGGAGNGGEASGDQARPGGPGGPGGAGGTPTVPTGPPVSVHRETPKVPVSKAPPTGTSVQREIDLTPEAGATVDGTAHTEAISKGGQLADVTAVIETPVDDVEFDHQTQLANNNICTAGPCLVD